MRNMRRYASSPFRIVLLAVLLGMAFLAAGAYAQDAANGAAAKPTGSTGLVSLILSNIDFVFVIIVGLSITGLYFIFKGFIGSRESVLLPATSIEEIKNLINQRKFKELVDFTEADPSFVSKALGAALKRAPVFSAMKEAMETSIGEQTAEQFRRIEYLNIIGNLGPLLGLLGTVLGMIYAFQAVATTGGQADVGALSNGISVALCHTFLGLFLAIPCLATFGVLRTMVDRLTIRGALTAEELLLMVKPQDQAKPSAPGAPRPAPAGVPQPPPALRRPVGQPAPAPMPGPAPLA